jgi:hypothetical protein
MHLITRYAIRAAGVAAVLGTAAVGLGVDVLIPAKISIVKPAKLAKFVSKSATGFSLPVPASADDPTTAGAQLRFFDTGGLAGSVTFTLGAAGWKGLGNPAGSKGYKYKGKDDPSGGACSTVLIKETVIKAVCKGTAVTLTPPFTATEGIIIGIPAGTAATLRYCAELGGTEKKNDATALKRKDAPAPADCPEEFVPQFATIDPNDLIELTDDALQGRNNNTPGSLAAQQILIDELNEMGAAGLNTSQTGDDAFKQPFVHGGSTGTNILAVIPGSELPNEYVMVGAHYDHLATCRTVEVGDTVCNGATDNASGVAATLAIGRAIAALPIKPRRSVILAFWDAEEDGLDGSAYYVNNPLVTLASTITYINFDIQGANLLPSLKNYTFAVGAELGVGLGALVQQAQADSGSTLDTRQLSYIFGQFRSDYVNFGNNGVVTVFFSDSTGPCYHTNDDELAIVDMDKLEQQTRTAYALTLELADTTTPPPFMSPNPGLATFVDAQIINEVLTLGLADLSLFSPADQMTLTDVQAEIAAIVADGEANFDGADVTTLLLDVVDVIDLLTRTTCDGFF